MSGAVATADVDETARIGPGTTVWHLAQIRENAAVGSDCVIGRGAYIGVGVRLGDRVKVQNQALIYEPAEVADDVFVGPAVVLTNDRHPRSVTAEGDLKSGGDWEPVGVVVDRGASLGARSVCVAPLRIGAWAMVGAGAVVIRDVPAHAVVVGVPARQVGWVGRSGMRLEADGPGRWRCPDSGLLYTEGADGLIEHSQAGGT